MIFQANGRVLENQTLGKDCFKLILNCPPIAKESKPGHFVHIQVNPYPFPLLRRAFSIYDTDGRETVEVVFKVVGQGTSLLSRKEPGDQLDLLGPLGNLFAGLKSHQIGIMVAGGLGIVPVYFYASALEKLNSRAPVYFLYGARDKSELYCLNDTERLKSKVFYSTDNGTHGYKGLLTQLLAELIAEEKLPKDKIQIYACGPEPMLAALSDYAVKNNFFCELSLEVGMPCGMGTCMGCVIKYKAADEAEVSYKRVCCEGPIFRAGEVIFD